MSLSLKFDADGVRDLQVLWEDSERALCRGRRGDASGGLASVLIEFPVAEHPPPLALDRLAHQYGLKDELDGAWAVRPLQLGRRHGRPMLVLEDPGGEPLVRLLGAPMEVEGFLRLAVSIATALSKLHRRDLIHKDIKPANILVNCADGQARLTGFGIGSRLIRERQAPAPPEVIAGTLAYMAPEQTGRMNRSIDARSDLYALGVTYYQMLTGSLPFTAADPMEWVHCHIARNPAPPDERVAGIPRPLSAIVMKLLAKNAEDRYQTAAGLTVDLRKCLAEWESHRGIAPFSLGASDASDRLLAPEKLYGREPEIETLLGAFARVVTKGATELVLVSGYAGIGKSSVVNELQKALVAQRGLFASGKFDQYKRDIPYATLTQAFRSLVRPLLGESEVGLSRWRDLLSEALGPNGQLIANLVPELELVIGKQPPVADLPPQDAKNRFQMVFRRFLSVFARKENPLALFLDDLQWLDAATLELLEHLVTHPKVRHLLLVGAYRGNEIGSAHPLMRTLEAIRTAGARVEEIVLTPLGLDDIGRLVTDALHCEPERARPLAQLVHQKTSGNPFFAIQFLTALNEDGLLVFDPVTPAWRWDIDRIRARSYTDNVADLLVEKMKRLSIPTQEALKQLACVGNVAEVATLSLAYQESEKAMHAALREAVHAGLVLRQESAYSFLHDRIQQAAYSLIPEETRADVHLRIGRALLASMTPDQLAEHLFDVATQLNRGAGRLIDGDEKARVATIDLRAGRRAKASAAYASGRVYLAAGMALLDERDWGSRYELIFSLQLELAQCEFLTGNFEEAEQLIAELLQRATSKIDQASVHTLDVSLRTAKSENRQAVNSAITCLRLFDIHIPAHPTFEHVQVEYEALWQNLDGRPIETLIDLPLMINLELRAAMQVLLVLGAPAYYTDFQLYCLLTCRVVNISLQHGICDTSASSFGALGRILGPIFHHYPEGYRFAELARNLIEKHGFIADAARVYFALGTTAAWSQPMTSAIGLLRTSFRTGAETGAIGVACYSLDHIITSLFLRNDPLDAVWRESEKSLSFVRKARFHDVAAVIVSQQRFIAAMQGRTATVSTFSDAQFDEAAFEAQLTENCTPTTVCLYWILKLKALFLSGNYVEAIAPLDKAKALLWASATHVQRLDYFYYAALTAAALFDDASTDEQRAWRDLLTAHGEQLREWAENYPPTFADKHALVSAEIARLEGRDAEAMRLYEQAIRSAHEHGFVQNKGLGYEVSARFYAARGFDEFAHLYLRNARHCYLQWGALGKVRQLDDRYPHLREEGAPTSGAASIGAPVTQLDVETVVKASQAVSGEIVLDNLIKTLMGIAVEHAGAERGVLILPRGDPLWIEAEATTGRKTVDVNLRQALAAPSELPLSILQYVIRTQEPVISGDACREKLFSADEYVASRQVRSVLCLPLIKQAKLVGLLYLENNVAASVFTPARIAVLKLLASQAAISLENARLHTELINENRVRKDAEEHLRQSEASLIQAQQISQTGSWYWNVKTGEVRWSAEHFRLFGYDPTTTQPSYRVFVEPIDPEDRRSVEQTIATAVAEKGQFQLDYRIGLPDGTIKHLRSIGRPGLTESGDLEYFGTVMDVTGRKRAEAEARDSERRYRELQMELAHANRVATMGQLTASIAHEVRQPITATAVNARTALRWLSARPPELTEARQALDRIVTDSGRADAVIDRIRALVKRTPQQQDRLTINEVIREVVALTRTEAAKNSVSVQTELADALPLVDGDRVQLQQVILNLIINAVEAMSGTDEGARELRITTVEAEPDSVFVAVSDSGPGLAPDSLEHLFEAFYTTKSGGLGLGLSICRSIIEAHGGRLWASANAPRGAVFQFTLPSLEDAKSA